MRSSFLLEIFRSNIDGLFTSQSLLNEVKFPTVKTLISSLLRIKSQSLLNEVKFPTIVNGYYVVSGMMGSQSLLNEVKFPTQDGQKQVVYEIVAIPSK